MSRGLYRTRGVGGSPNDAHMTDGAVETDIPEALYRARDYNPFFGNLPWKEDYLAAKSAGVKSAGVKAAGVKAARGPKDSKGHRNSPRPKG